MARYVFEYLIGDKLVGYLESTPEEDKMDAGVEEFDGSGYLSFWKRSKKVAMDWNELIMMCNNNKVLMDVLELEEIPEGERTATIYDNWYDAEKAI